MRHAITCGGLLLFVAVMLGSASPAAAVDVQGSYDAKITCTVYPNGEKPQKSSGTAPVVITQTGQALAMQVDGLGIFAALVSDDGVHTNKGVIGGGSCPNGNPLIAFGLLGKVNVASTGDAGTLMLDVGGAFVPVGGPIKCHLTAKRTSAVDPGVGSCPP